MYPTQASDLATRHVCSRYVYRDGEAPKPQAWHTPWKSEAPHAGQSMFNWVESSEEPVIYRDVFVCCIWESLMFQDLTRVESLASRKPFEGIAAR
jgi:hypothetical protein